MGEDYDLIADGAGLFERRIGKFRSHRFFERKTTGAGFRSSSCRVGEGGGDSPLVFDRFDSFF